MDCVKRIWYLSHMRAVKVQASLRIRAVSPEPSLLAHTSSESRGTFRQKARSLAPLNGWACAVKICHDGMLEDTNSLDGAHMKIYMYNEPICFYCVIVSIFHEVQVWGGGILCTSMIVLSEQGHEKMCHVICEQQVQISLRICTVWSAPLLLAA